MYNLFLNNILHYFFTNIFQQKAEVYCTHCSMMICRFCRLCLHFGHNLKGLTELHEEIKIHMSEELDKLKY